MRRRKDLALCDAQYTSSCFDDHFPKESNTVDEYSRCSLERFKYRKLDKFGENLVINFHCQTNLYWENARKLICVSLGLR